jgi:hypothetical protein
MRRGWLVLFVFFPCSSGLLGQTIQGKLLEAGSDRPILLGRVSLLTGGGVVVDRTFTDEEGAFAVWSPEPGSFFLRAEAIGYASRVDGVFELALLGFYSRQRAGFGRFLGPEDIRKRPAFDATDYLRNIPRVRIRHRARGGSEVLIRGASSISLGGDGLCRPKVVVDGNEVFRGGREAAVLDEVVTPFEISAIEVYRGPSEIPLQFGGLRSPCGLILIWTK